MSGITLIALVITIVIMIILSSIGIQALTKTGIFEKAKIAKEKYSDDQKQEDATLSDYENEITEVSSTRDSSGGMPTGALIAQMGNKAPNGYLACDGTEYKISEYKVLAEYIKEQFGSYNYFGGDGTKTFKVPDLRGEFLRGTGTNSHTNQGNGETVGTHQDATQHFWEWRWGDKAWTPIAESQLQNFDSKINDVNRSYAGAFSEWYNSSTYPLYYTSRPTNTSVLYCIKY